MSEHDLREVWRRRSARAASSRAGCLTEDDFARLLSGEASADERARVAQHLATCSSCADELELLEPLRDWAGDAVRVLAPDAAPVRPAAAPTRWGLPARTGWLLAAASVLIAIGAGLFVLQMRQRGQVIRLEGQIAQQQHALSNAQSTIASLQAQIEAQRRQSSTTPGGAPSLSATPLLDVPIVDVEPAGSGASRGSGGTQSIAVPRDAKAVVLILNFPPLEARTTIGIEIADDQGQTRWSGTTERPRQTASLNLTLPREAFPAGTYRIRLTKAGTRQDAIAVYGIALR